MKHTHRKPLWSKLVQLALIFACPFLLVWQVQRVMVAEAADEKFLGPPTKVRSRERPALTTQEVPPATLSRFLERLGTGMSDREIRWMAEDFFNAGLGIPLGEVPPETYVARRAAQHRWLLLTLAEGLGLQPDQKAAATKSLDQNFKASSDAFYKAIENSPSFEHEGKVYHRIDESLISRMIDASVWMQDESYAPWNLCPLTPGQLEVTWHDEFIEKRRNNPSAAWTGSSQAFRVFDAETDQWIAMQVTGVGRVGLDGSGKIYPLIDLQVGLGNDLLVQARVLHPAQFRTLLLDQPGAAAHFIELLDAAE